MIIHNRLGRTLEVTAEVVKLETAIMGRAQVIPRKLITTVQLSHSMYDLPWLEKTLTFWTQDGKKHVIKHLKSKTAEEAANELNQYVTA